MCEIEEDVADGAALLTILHENMLDFFAHGLFLNFHKGNMQKKIWSLIWHCLL